MTRAIWQQFMTPDGRRALALLFLVLGGVVMTGFAAFGVYQVRNSTGLSFWLALAAHVQVLLVLSGIAALLIKRTFKASRDGVEISDQQDATP